MLMSDIVKAQEAYLSGVSYQVSIPNSGLKEFIDKESYRGFNAQSRLIINKTASVGFQTGIYPFLEKSNGTFISPDDGAEVTGTRVRYINTIPLMFNGHLYLGDGIGGFSPYVGTGIGALVSLERTDIGVFAIQNNNWHFGFEPEIGVFAPIADNIQLNIAIKYTHAIATDDSLKIRYWGISLGIFWLDYPLGP